MAPKPGYYFGPLVEEVAAAVVALLGLTEQWGSTGEHNGAPDLREAERRLDGMGVCREATEAEARGWAKSSGSHLAARWVGPWREVQEEA